VNIAHTILEVRDLASEQMKIIKAKIDGGVGNALLDQAKQEAEKSGAKRIDLQTAQDNVKAQKLYKTFGYDYSDEFQNWSYSVNY